MNIAITNLQKAECFASIFQHIKLLTENINIMFEEERMYLQCMDSARVSIFEITIPKTWFDEYTHSVPGGKTIGISSSIFYKILNARDKSQALNIVYKTDEGNDDKLFIRFTQGDTKNNFDKHFEIPLIDIDCELMTIPAIDYQAEMSIPSSNFANIVNQLKMFGDTMEIQCSEEKIMLYSTSPESGKMLVEIKIDDLTAFSINEGEELRLSFSLTYLHNICMYNKLAKDIDLKVSTNYPMRIDYDLGDGAQIVFYLAPKMDDSD